jgi:two-component system OmpR family response regulator
VHLLYVTNARVDDYLIKALREAGHVVEAADQPADALVMAAVGDHQAVVLDWAGAPAACVARFAAASAWALVVVITASGDEASRARVLQAGADACFTRPLTFIELEARLEALERLVQRTRPANAEAAAEMVAAEQAVRLNGCLVALSQREFRVVTHLVAHAGEVVGLEQLQHQAWGDAAEPRPDLMQAALARLRRKLGTAGAASWLRAVGGHGYVFRPAPMALDQRTAIAVPQDENVLTWPIEPR